MIVANKISVIIKYHLLQTSIVANSRWYFYNHMHITSNLFWSTKALNKNNVASNWNNNTNKYTKNTKNTKKPISPVNPSSKNKMHTWLMIGNSLTILYLIVRKLWKSRVCKQQQKN